MTESNKLSALRVIDLEPYITGKQFTGEVKAQPRMNTDVYTKFMTMLSESSIAREFFNAYESYKDFYTTAADFKALIPKEYQAEAFYAAKCECFYVEVPSFCVYMLKKAYKEAREIPNLMFKYLPFPVLTEWFKQGYFLGGLTLRDVICNICTEEYQPLKETQLKVKYKEFTEIYVPDTDMVAAVPNKIGDLLDDNGILAIVEKAEGLSTNGVLLRSMAGYVGAINSTYDLRKLI